MTQLDKVLNVVNIFEQRGEDIVLVVSAFEGVTNLLYRAMDILDGKDYSESDIDAAFQPVRQAHEKIIENEKFFRDEYKTEAYRVYDSAFSVLKMALMSHKKVRKSLSMLPNKETYEIRDQVIGFGEDMARTLLGVFLRQERKATKVFENVRCEKTDADKKITNRGVERGIHDAIRGALSEKPVTSEVDGVSEDVHKNVIRIFGGHIGGTPRGIAIDEGPGYSDVSAVDVGVVLKEMGENVKKVRFLKDVRGIYTANPKNLDPKRNNAYLHRDVSLKEAIENAGAGSKLINVRALSRARRHGVNLEIRDINNLEDDVGTDLTTANILTQHAFKTIVSNMYVDVITIDIPEMADEHGFAAAITDVFKKRGLSIDGIFTEGTSMTFSVPVPEREADRKVVRETIRSAMNQLKIVEVNEEQYSVDELEWDKSRASISVIGVEMHDRVGMLANISGVFSAFGINVTAVVHGAKQTRIHYLVDKKDLKRAEQLLHSIFVDNDREVIEEFKRRRSEQTDELTSTFQN